MSTTPNVRVDISYQTDADKSFIKRQYLGSATLTSSFNTTLRQFQLVSNVGMSVDAEVIRNADSTLQNNFNIIFGHIFEGDIINQFDMSSSFGITATADKLREGQSSLQSKFIQPQTDSNIVAYVHSNLPGVLSIPKALPFGVIVDTDPTTLVGRATVNANTDLFEGVFVNMPMPFVLTDGTELVEGTNRKFTTAQLTAIAGNSTQIVDFVEIITNYRNPDLELEDQVRVPPVLRWNSSGRDLDIIDYKGNSNHYKGKNVLMRLPSFEYNGMFTKKTLKIEINGLLRYFNQAMILGYLDYAPVTMGKAIFDYDHGTVTQIDNAVLLLRGHVNSFTLSGTPDQQSTTIEVDSGFYDYDRRVATRANSESYENHMKRLGEMISSDVTDISPDLVGNNITQSVTWGADVVV